jgi:hypothetical protein
MRRGPRSHPRGFECRRPTPPNGGQQARSILLESPTSKSSGDAMPNAVDASNLRRTPLEQPRPAPSASLNESPTGLPLAPSAPAQPSDSAAGTMSDGYAQPSPSPGALVGVASQASPVAALVGDLSVAANWRELPSQFASDFRAVKAQLLEFPGLNSVDRADRMVAFFAKYAERFVALAPPGSSPSRLAAIQGFLSELDGLGYGALFEATTRESALDEAERLLGSSSAEEFLSQASRLHFRARDLAPLSAAEVRRGARPLEPRRLSGPGAPPEGDGPRSSAMAPGGRPLAPAGAPTDPNRSEGESKRRDRGRWTDKVLGPNLLWNVLHRSRSDGLAGEAEEDRHLERWGLVALLVLAGVIGLVVSLILVM